MSENAVHANDDFMLEMLGDFLDESTGILRQLNEDLLKLEGHAKSAEETHSPADLADTLNAMFRGAHSLKGLSAMLRLNAINGLTHKVENVFDAARNGEVQMTVNTVDLVFRAVDQIEALVEVLRSSSDEEPDCSPIINEIEQLLQRSGKKRDTISAVDIEKAFAQNSIALSISTTDILETNLPSATPESGSASVCSEDALAGVVDDQEIPAKYLAIFIDESELTIEDLCETLLTKIDAQSVEPLLVGCHRLKGSAASIGLNRIARLAHFMEDLLQDLRRDSRCPSEAMCDALLKCLDAIRLYIGGVKSGVTNDTLGDAGQELLSVIGHTANLAAEFSPPPPSDKSISAGPKGPGHDVEFQKVRASSPELSRGIVGYVGLEEGLPLREMKARFLLEKLRQLGTVFYCSPADHEFEKINELPGLTFGLATDIDVEMVRQAMRMAGVTEIEITKFGTSIASSEPIDSPLANTSTSKLVATLEHPIPEIELDDRRLPVTASSTHQKNKPAETLRVDIDRLDQLMNLAGQLVINKARFSQIGVKLKGLSSLKSISQSMANVQTCAARLNIEAKRCADVSPAQIPVEAISDLAEKISLDMAALKGDLEQIVHLRGVVNDLSEAVHQLDRVSEGIQTTVMDTRMVPIGPLFARFKRVVRDLTRDSLKEINLAIHGENTELDKRMIDELGDPLIHLIRNSADHGIEPSEQRIAAGKPSQGTITLNAFHRGNRIMIQVTDDGKGLDADRIRAKASARGLINEVEAERMSEQQLHQLVWQPGFSTAERITEVSGRGMGMDIVWSKIEQLNGTIELVSQRGQGTTFTIKLPLTMAILPSLLVVIDEDVFAVPVESVVEIVQVFERDSTSVHGQKAVCVRGRVISVVELSDLFQWQEPAARVARPADHLLTLVIVGSEGHELGLIVNSLLGEHDVVIKSLEENFQSVEGIAGASILGDGRVSLILDIGMLLEMANRTSPSAIQRMHGPRTDAVPLTNA